MITPGTPFMERLAGKSCLSPKQLFLPLQCLGLLARTGLVLTLLLPGLDYLRLYVHAKMDQDPGWRNIKVGAESAGAC